MTQSNERSLIAEYEATSEGAQGLAAADLAAQVVDVLRKALDASGMDQKELASKLGVSEGRVSQVLNSDGNLRVAAVARYLRALGYEASITAAPVEPGRSELSHRGRRGRDAHERWAAAVEGWGNVSEWDHNVGVYTASGLHRDVVRMGSWAYVENLRRTLLQSAEELRAAGHLSFNVVFSRLVMRESDAHNEGDSAAWPEVPTHRAGCPSS